MAPVAVATLNAPGSAGPYAAPLTAPIPLGSNAIVAVQVTSGAVADVTDTRGQQYAPIGSVTSGTTSIYLFQCQDSLLVRAGTGQVIVTLGGGSVSPVNITAVSVPGTAGADTSVFPVTATGTGTTASAATGTRGQPRETLLAFEWTAASGGSPAWSGAFSALGSLISGHGAGFLTSAADVVTTAATSTATATFSTPAAWMMIVIGLGAPETAGAIDSVAVTAAAGQAELAGAADSITVSPAATQPITEAAGATDAILVVNTTARSPWVIPAAADSTSASQISFAQAPAAASGIAVGQQFQLYSGQDVNGGQGRLNANMSFEAASVSPWTGQHGAALSVSPLNAFRADLGTHSCLITPDGVTARPQMASEVITIRPGQMIAAAAHITASATWAPGAALRIEWYDAAMTLLASSQGPAVALASGAQAPLAIPATIPPATATRIILYCVIQGTPPAATLFYADIIYPYMVAALLQPQIFTITALNTAFGFTTATFSPAASLAPVFWHTAHQVAGAAASGAAASPAFIRSRIPRVHAQNLLTREWIHRDVQGITQPLITWNLNGADTFTATISPPRDDLLHPDTKEPLLVSWQTALYLEENDEIRFGGIITDQTFAGPQWGITATGFAGYPNGIPYEGPVLVRNGIDGLDVVRFLWLNLQAQPGGNLGMEIGTALSGVSLGVQVPPPTATTTLDGDAVKNSIAIRVRGLSRFSAGMLVLIGDEATKVRNTGDVPAHVKYHGAGPEPGTKGTYLTLSRPLDHWHGDGFRVHTDMPATPFELNWWSGTDIGQEIAAIQQEAVFDYRERHHWSGPEKADVRHKLEFGVPRIGARHPDLRFHEGENIVVAGQVHQDGALFANEVVGIGAGQGTSTLRVTAAQTGDRLRRVLIYTDQTIRRPERLAVRARRQLQARLNPDTVASITVMNHPNAPFGSFAPGDDIPVRLASGWRSVLVWSRILSMAQDPTTDLMTLTLARSDSFTLMAETGEAGTL